jgi:hypothetical protein
MTVEILDEDVDDDEAVVIAWLNPLLPEGHVSNERKPGGPLPYYMVTHLEDNESVEESTVDSLISVHVLTHKSAGQVANRDEARTMHRRMLLLARYLEDVALPGGDIATIDFVKVSMRPRREDYGDEQILRRVGRYNLGFTRAKVQ